MNKSMGNKYCIAYAKALLIALCILSVTACSSVSTAKREFAEDLSATILSHDDPATIKQAVPAYLILIDSMIRGDQENVDLLISG